MAEHLTRTVHPAGAGHSPAPEAGPDANQTMTPRSFRELEAMLSKRTTGPMTAASSGEEAPEDSGDLVQQLLLRDIDAIIARLDVGIAKENAALDALLARLTQTPA